jgi:hypothetical protein
MGVNRIAPGPMLRAAAPIPYGMPPREVTQEASR